MGETTSTPATRTYAVPPVACPVEGIHGAVERTTADKPRSGVDQAIQGQPAHDKPVPRLMVLNLDPWRLPHSPAGGPPVTG